MYIIFISFYKNKFYSFNLNFDGNNKLINHQKTQLDKKRIKVCICTVGKQENKYIREFVDYYEKYGVDKIFLYDNNDEDGENFEEVIKDYIDKGFIQIHNWRGIKKPGKRIIRDCYMNNNQSFDWLIFYDIDEYIHLENITNIKEFLKDTKFNKCKKIYLNWVMHTDNNLLKYDNRSLHQRFPELEPHALKKKRKYSAKGKTIIRGGIKNIHISGVHLIDNSILSCNSKGKIIKFKKGNDHMNDLDFENYFIDHYYFKSLEEFIKKIKKGDTYYGFDKVFMNYRIKRFFRMNKITLKKIEYIENNLGINLSNYKKKLTNI